MSDESKVHRINRKPVAAEVPDMPEPIITDKISSSGHGPKFDMPEAEETPTYSDAMLQEMAAQKIAESKAQAEVAAGAQQIHGSWQTGYIGTAKTLRTIEDLQNENERLAAGGGSVYDYLGRGFDAERSIAELGTKIDGLVEWGGAFVDHYNQTIDAMEENRKLYDSRWSWWQDVRQKDVWLTYAVIAAVAFAIGRAR